MLRKHQKAPVIQLAGLGLLLLVGAGFLEEVGPLLETLANFRLHLALASAGLVLLALLRGAYRATLLPALALAAALAGLGPVWSPAERPGEGVHLVLLYANLRDANPDQAGLAEELARSGADVVITSETRPEAAAVLGRRYPHRVVAQGRRSLRTALWSRLPLAEGALHLDNTVAPTGASARVLLPGGRSLGVIGVHFSRAPEGLHMRQAAALGAIAAKLGEPLVIVGDFNAEPWTRVVRAAAKASRTTVTGGWRATWRGAYPTPLGPVPALLGHQIDQVLVSEGLGVERIGTIALPGSDHRGLLVELRVP